MSKRTKVGQKTWDDVCGDAKGVIMEFLDLSDVENFGKLVKKLIIWLSIT